MTDIVRTRLEADVNRYVAGMKLARQSTDEFFTNMRKARGEANSFAGEMDTLGKNQGFNLAANGALVLGGAVAGLGALAVSEFARFDKAVSNVTATGEDAKRAVEGIRDSALEAGRTTAYTATEAAGAMEALFKAGVSASDVLGGALAGSLDLAAAGEISVAEAAETAATAMVQFQRDGGEVGHIADLLAAGASKAMGDVHDMAWALKQGGLVAAQFDASLEETVGTLTAFAANGLIGSDAGTSFKNMLLKLANPSKQAQRWLDELGITAFDASGKFIGLAGLAEQLKVGTEGLTDATRNQAFATIFGTDAIRSASVLWKEGREGIEKWTDAVNDAGYAERMAADRLDNLMGDWKKFTGAWEGLMIQVGEGADGPLRNAVQGLTDLVRALSGDPELLNAVVEAIATIGATALVTGGLMKAVTFWGSYVRAMEAVRTEAPRAAGALGKLTKGGLIVGGLALIAQGIGSIRENLRGVAPGAEEAEAALDAFVKRNDRRGFDAMFKNVSGGQLVGEVDNMDDAFKRINQTVNLSRAGFMDWGNSMDIAFSFVTQSKSDVDTLKDAVRELAPALANADPTQASNAFGVLADKWRESGGAVDGLIELVPEYAKKVTSVASSQGLVITSAEALNNAMQGNWELLRQENAQLEKNEATRRRWIEQMHGITPEVRTALDALDSLVTAHATLTGIQELVIQTTEDEGIAFQGNAAELAEYQKAAEEAAKAEQELRDEVAKTAMGLGNYATAWGAYTDERKRIAQEQADDWNKSIDAQIAKGRESRDAERDRLRDSKKSWEDFTSSTGKITADQKKAAQDQADAWNRSIDDQIRAGKDLTAAEKDRLRDSKKTWQDYGGDAQKAAEDQKKAAKEQADAWNKNIDEQIKANSKLSESERKTREDSKKTWEDFYDDATVNLHDYLVHLRESVADQQEWQANLIKLAARVPADIAAELAKDTGNAGLVKSLLEGSDADVKEFIDLYRQAGVEASDAFANAFRAGQPVWEALMKKGGKKAVDAAAAEIGAGKATIADVIAEYDLDLEFSADYGQPIKDTEKFIAWVARQDYKAEVAIDDKNARRGINELETMIKNAKPPIEPKMVLDNALQVLNEFRAKASEAISVRVNPIVGQIGSALGSAFGFKFAGGGPIRGPGTGTSDSIPILASNGEYMIREWAARKLGLDRLEFLNRYGELPGFKDGGGIGQVGQVVNNSTRQGDVYVRDIRLDDPELARALRGYLRRAELDSALN